LGQIEKFFSISILTSENCVDYAPSIFLHGSNILIFGTAWLMVQIILILVQVWTHDPSIFASGPGFVLWFKQFCLWLRLSSTGSSSIFAYGRGLVLFFKHFCSWLRVGFMVQA
jgi:hypothetical protein